VNQFLAGTIENNGFIIMANNNQKFSKFFLQRISNFDYRPSLELNIPTIDTAETIVPNLNILHQNYPNPFNPSTTISFSNPSEQEAILTIYNAKGQMIRQF
jgi:hypothetical protein